MKLAASRMTPIAGIAVLFLVGSGCGKSADDPAAPTASPSPVAQATPAPAPTPVPTPVPPPDPRSDLAPGPVVSVKAYLKTVESTHGSLVFRDAQKDKDDVFTLYVGEFVTIDSTQRNIAGQVCRWNRTPVYFWDNDDDMMDMRDSDQPFFFRFLVAKPGFAQVTSKIDGIESNDVKMRAIPRPK
jgi:hypothetical protein